MIKQKIFKSLLKSLSSKKKPLEITDSSLLKEDLGIDSIMMVAILFNIAKETKINIFEGDLSQLADAKTVGDLVDAIEKIGN